MKKVLAIANQKGGVGKTTTAINLGAALGAFERRVLVVDCDPQGNATRGLGCTADPPTLYQVLTDAEEPRDAVRATGFPYLDLLPADGELVGIEVEFVDLEGWQTRLRERLDQLAEGYDYVLIDCPPSLGHLTVSALIAAQGLIVPLQSEYFALEGLSSLMKTVRRVASGWNQDLELTGIVLTMYDERTNLSKDVADEVRAHFPSELFTTVVPRNVRLAEAPSHGKTVLEYDIKSRGAQAYLALAAELMRRS